MSETGRISRLGISAIAETERTRCRCEACQGNGIVCTEMHFRLTDVLLSARPELDLNSVPFDKELEMSAWRFRLIGLSVVGALLSMGCGDSKKVEVGESCLLNSDCRGQLVCTMGKCHEACRVSSDCFAGQSCIKLPEGPVCQLPAERGCATAVCNPTLLCAVDLQCRVPCQTVANCADGQACVGGVCADPIDLDLNGQLPQRVPLADAGVKDADIKDVMPADAGLAKPDALPDSGEADMKTPDANLMAGPETGVPDTRTSDTSSTADTAVVLDVPAADGGSQVPTGCSAQALSQRYFCDDFESGLAKWTVSGQDWNTTVSTARSPTHSLTDSPDGNYAVDTEPTVTLTSSISLIGATAPVLIFWEKVNLYSSSGCGSATCVVFLVEASTDGGSTWVSLSSRQNQNTGTWRMIQVSLATYKDKNVKVRFRLDVPSGATTADGWYVDDVEVREAN